MRLYLARHGEAGRAAVDDQRQLTDLGRTESDRVFQRCVETIDGSLHAIMCSPLVRAKQTAEIALNHLSVENKECLVTTALRPEASIAGLAAMLENQQQWPLMLVGHQPLLGNFLGWLCDDRDLHYSVATSSIFAVDVIAFVRGCGTLATKLFP
ncbi:MAG: phosphohistidine phosphatase SixA [Porticoccaceae bacterium]|nr:phosphohistidine phosphatase SixA [Porticoccaceae bacterium]